MSTYIVPRPRGLFHAIDRLVQPTDVCRLVITSEPRRLCHVHLLVQITLAESIVGIKLTEVSFVVKYHIEDDANCGKLDDQTECSVEINALPLSEVFCKLACFVSVNGPICIPFDP